MRVHDGQICLAGEVIKFCKFPVKHTKYHSDDCINYSQIRISFDHNDVPPSILVSFVPVIVYITSIPSGQSRRRPVSSES